MCSCSSTLYPLTDRGCTEINEKAADKGGTIVLRITEEEIEAETIRLQQDSLYWTLATEEMPGYRRQQAPIPVEMIGEIKISNHFTGLLVWGGVGFIPLFIVLLGQPENQDEKMARGFGIMLTTILFATLGIIGYVNGIDDHYLITDPNQWPEFGAVGKAVLAGRKDRIGVELDKIINSSQDENLVTTALFLKMQYELGDPVVLYEELKSRYPGHIYARLAERLLREEYGIRPVNP
jgi:hypothetical protein